MVQCGICLDEPLQEVGELDSCCHRCDAEPVRLPFLAPAAA
jgi:hypothetical protein